MKKHNLFKIFSLFTLFIFFFFITANNYVSATFQNISSNVFRLHIIANSNSIEDQSLKLKVRDNILEYFNSQNISFSNKEEVSSFILEHSDNIKEVCTNTLKSYNCNLPVELYVGESFFPSKDYFNISFPAGIYSCLKIKIGNSIGQNWWCSLFPPLCFSNISNGYVKEDDNNALQQNLSNEEFLLLSSDETNIKLKFKIIEIINSLKNSIS